MVVVVASLKGSAGVTTLAAALAAVWPHGRAVLVEADPAGGDLGGWHGVADEPGLASLATANRSGSVSVAEHCTQLGFGAQVVIAAAGRAQASAAITALAQADPPVWAKQSPTVVDLGRWEPGHPGWRLAKDADAAVLVTRGDVASLKRVRDAELDAVLWRLVVVGPSMFDPREIAATLGLEVAASVPWDRHGAEVIAGVRPARVGWTRRGLPAAARALANALHTPTHATGVGT